MVEVVREVKVVTTTTETTTTYSDGTSNTTTSQERNTYEFASHGTSAHSFVNKC